MTGTEGSRRPEKLVIVGQGYVGLPIAMRAARAGFQVTGYDTDPVRVAALREGVSYVEDIPDEALISCMENGTFTPTDDVRTLAEFDYAIITVPTPLKETVPDLSFIEAAAVDLALHVRRGSTVVLESTTYPGTTEELLVPMLEDGSGLKASQDFFVGYSPERIDPGNRQYTFENTPKVVSGIDPKSLEHVAGLYERLVDEVIRVSSPKTAELTKLLENTFRHVNIALVNELAVFAHDLGIDVWEAIDAATTKPFGYMRFTPGPGVGGHCLPVDPSYLSWQVRRTLGNNFRFVELANDVNDHMPNYVVQRVTAGLNAKRKAVNGTRVLLIGLAYKKNTGDARESPALRVADLLQERGAIISAVDPYVEDHKLPSFIRLVDLDEASLADVDAVVILTDHDDLDYTLLERTDAYVLDTRRRLGGVREVI